jgi:hypothetical protein
MRRRLRPGVALAAGAVLLGLAWTLGPRSAPPLYDSGPIVAEHYRYLHKPAGYTNTAAPGAIDVTLNLLGGQSPPMAETTDEQPSQAQLLAAQNAFAVPPRVPSVHVSIRAIDPPAPAPSGYTFDGNVYSFLVTATGGTTPLPFRAGQQVTVVLRGPAGVSNPLLEVWDGTTWSKLDTQPLGSSSPDSYAANVNELGDIALVAPPQSTGGGSGGVNGGIIVAVVVTVVVCVAAAVVLGLRRRR